MDFIPSSYRYIRYIYGENLQISLVSFGNPHDHDGCFKKVHLISAGAMGAYALGANNITNVIGVIIPVEPFPEIQLGQYSVNSTQQFILGGGLSIAVGVYNFFERRYEIGR